MNVKSRCTNDNMASKSSSVRHVATLLGVLACCLLFPAREVEAFLTQSAHRGIVSQSFAGGLQRFAESETSTASVQGSAGGSATDDDNNPCHLPAELKKIADAFERIGDDKLRYKQLLFMANQAKPMDAASQIPENQVPGCLSTVFVDGTAEKDNDDSEEDYRIHFVGDSDGLLTKGLVALLVRGLSGSTADEIRKVDPVFIQKCGISTSLTPGRNNGFLNMLAVMKKKALELEAAAKEGKSPASTGAGDVASDIGGAAAGGGDEKPMYTAIRTALQQLQPVSMDLKDVSYQHAGHVEGGDGEESHFELEIVADAFDGLNLVKRHQLIYMMLGEVMPQIHALQIRANTPAEVQK